MTATLSSKRLMGVELTPALKDLLDQFEIMSKEPPVVTGMEENHDDDSIPPLVVVDPRRELALDQAVSIIRRFRKEQESCEPASINTSRRRHNNHGDCSKEKEEETEDANDNAPVVPISVLRALYTVYSSPCNADNNAASVVRGSGATSVQDLDSALRGNRLRFGGSGSTAAAGTTTTTTKKDERFERRMERLRLQQEERRYQSLAGNVGVAPQSDDHVTVRSMTYAASIGLNMIVAPLSFGCLMYFFAGGLLDFVWKDSTSTGEDDNSSTSTASNASNAAGGADIKKVIVAVISGVCMLFIEMILFVIRTHELDRAVRKKQKKQKHSPFGFYTADTSKTYKD